MAAVAARMSTVVINTTDIDRLLPFWRQLLAVGVAHRIGDMFVWLDRQSGAGVGLAFQRVPDPTPGRRRLHIDLEVEDLDAAQARIEALGGECLELHEIDGFRWRVMADPDGNEFCIAVSAG